MNTNLLLAILLLLSLVSGCAESPTKPTTSGGSSSGSGKIVTATPEEPFECDDDLILEPHLPEECIPPEPPEPPEPVAQTPVEPPKVDPIVGTYKAFPTNPKRVNQTLLRLYPDGSVSLDGNIVSYKRWERAGERYLYLSVRQGKKVGNPFVWKYEEIAGEPNIVPFPGEGGRFTSQLEAIKLSDDPRHQLDFYLVQCRRGENRCMSYNRDIRRGWTCYNAGRRSPRSADYYITAKGGAGGNATFWGETLAECEARCEQAVKAKFGSADTGEGNCSDYRP